jgi:hypothetical protein
MVNLFPLSSEPANTNEELSLLKEKYSLFNNTYINLHMRPDWAKAKHFFDTVWLKYEPFADDNFLSELQINFSQRAWELYLFYLLDKSSLKILSQSKNKPNPDFKVEFGKRNIFIEAVTVGKGEGHNRVETISDLLSKVPSGTIVSRGGSFDEFNHPKVRRITSSLREKLENYLNKHKNVIGNEDYYVIALNAGEIDGNLSSSPEALILEALKGINPAIHLPLQVDNTLGPAYHTSRFSITNSLNTNLIDLDLFSKKEFGEISGVLYFGRDIINAVLQDVVGEEVIFVHNPNVLKGKEIPLDVFSQFTQITISPTEWIRHTPPYRSVLI